MPDIPVFLPETHEKSTVLSIGVASLELFEKFHAFIADVDLAIAKHFPEEDFTYVLAANFPPMGTEGTDEPPIILSINTDLCYASLMGEAFYYAHEEAHRALHAGEPVVIGLGDLANLPTITDPQEG